MHGDPARAVLHTTDATTAAPIPIYKAGSETTHTLQPNEFFVITGATFSGAGSSNRVQVFVDEVGAAAATAGNTLIEHFLTTIPSAAGTRYSPGLCGAKGHAPHLVTSGGALISVTLTGYIQQA